MKLVTESSDRWTVSIEGATVTEVGFGFGIRLLIWTVRKRGLELRIGCPFRFEDVDGQAHVCDPEQLGNLDVVRMYHLFNQTIRECWATPKGDLTMTFRSGVLLHVPADPDYEAWQITANDDDNRELLICMPGGDLAYWGPEPEG
jgi:hypothetical protein